MSWLLKVPRPDYAYVFFRPTMNGHLCNTGFGCHIASCRKSLPIEGLSTALGFARIFLYSRQTITKVTIHAISSQSAYCLITQRSRALPRHKSYTVVNDIVDQRLEGEKPSRPMIKIDITRRAHKAMGFGKWCFKTLSME
jgi:hypothetical protein